MKSLVITCAIILSATLLAAQTEKKKTTVRIKKVENINGVEKVTDTTYVTDNPSDLKVNEGNTNIEITTDGNGNKQKFIMITDETGSAPEIKIEEGQNGTSAFIINSAGDGSSMKKEMIAKDPNGKTEVRTIVINGGDKMTAEEQKVWQDKMMKAINTDDGKNSEMQDMEGKTIILKRPASGCGASKEEIEKTPVYCYVSVTKKVRITELSDEDKKMLSGKPSALNDGKLNVEEMKFYPNPNNGKFNLAFNLTGKGNTEINIMDLQGRNIYSEKLADFTGKYDKEIDISKNPKGTYFVKVQQGDHAQLKKIILE